MHRTRAATRKSGAQAYDIRKLESHFFRLKRIMVYLLFSVHQSPSYCQIVSPRYMYPTRMASIG